MWADLVAAYLDFDDVPALMRAVVRGEAPRPTNARLRGRAREPLWSLDGCRAFVFRRHGVAEQGEADDLAELL